MQVLTKQMTFSGKKVLRKETHLNLFVPHLTISVNFEIPIL